MTFQGCQQRKSQTEFRIQKFLHQSEVFFSSNCFHVATKQFTLTKLLITIDVVFNRCCFVRNRSILTTNVSNLRRCRTK